MNGNNNNNTGGGGGGPPPQGPRIHIESISPPLPVAADQNGSRQMYHHPPQHMHHQQQPPLYAQHGQQHPVAIVSENGTSHRTVVPTSGPPGLPLGSQSSGLQQRHVSISEGPPGHQTASSESEGGGTLRSRKSSPLDDTWETLETSGRDGPERPFVVVPPPTLRPQHVYAPVAPLGMLTLGVFSKKNKEDQDAEFKKLTFGNNEKSLFSV